MTAPFIRNPYNYDLEAASKESSQPADGESMTIQSQRDDADLNVLMKRFGVTGKMPDDVRPVFYGDFDEVFDFRTAQNAIRAASESFMQMPADLRMRFSNDPQNFLEFCSATDDGKTLKNLDEMRKLGLAVPAPEVKIETPVATAEPKK